MKFTTGLLCVSMSLQAIVGHAAVAPYVEQIRADGLLGSHFGFPGVNASFDYVVIGGRTAGLTVARRLAENGTFSVAVVEAGSFVELGASNFSSLPYQALSGGGAQSPLVSWQQSTIPQINLMSRTIPYTRGKVLGGCSNLNAMGYQRPSKGTFQAWADVVGDSSYEWDQFLPYYKSSITFHPPQKQYLPSNDTLSYNLSASGSGGALQVSYPRHLNPSASWFFQAARALHIPSGNGWLDGNLDGYGHLAYSLDPSTQTRSTSETGSLRQALRHFPNLITYQSTLARKILFNNEKKAIAVLVETTGLSYQIEASREVVLSAGAFRSPQLLQVSGIGNSQLLESLAVPVISDLPGVGQNIQDSLLFGPASEINLVTHSALNDPEFYAKALAEYQANRTGILTNTGADTAIFERFTVLNISKSTADAVDRSFPSNWPTVVFNSIDGIPVPNASPGKDYFGIYCGVLSTFSRGNMTITTTDTNDNPIVNMNYLSDPRDREIAVAAFKRTRTLAQAMGAILIGEELVPGKNVSTDAQILNYIMETATPYYHASCSCRQGKEGDKMAVVDSRGRVFGVQSLRVIDVSSLPFLPPGLPQATIYALAKKLTTTILNRE